MMTTIDAARSCDADALEAAGDQLLRELRLAEALEKFLEAEVLGSVRPALYQKLIDTHKALTTTWTEADMARSLAWEMHKQSLEHPEVRITHERLAPEWQEVTERLRRLIIAKDAAVIGHLVGEIAAFREKAVHPLLDFILLLKTAHQPPPSADTSPSSSPPETDP
ncbi:MAG: hypothetical protein HYV02_02805 [Deltaproteobacteria bacterium]|nr:hypothetical protein [Deltaproteobacteria bacterium]